MSDIKSRLAEILGWKKSKTYYAEHLNVDVEDIEKALQELRVSTASTGDQLVIGFDEECRKINKDKGTLESTVVSSFDPKNDQELADLHKVDLSRYKISSYWTKQRGDKFTSSLLCTLIKPEEFNEDRFTAFLSKYKSAYKSPRVKWDRQEGGVDVEISLSDVHLDKLDITEENIATRKEQYMEVLTTLLSNIDLYAVNKIVFVIGNDLFHTDTFQNTTTNGTPLTASTTWFNAYEQGFDLMVRAITLLKSYTKRIEVVLVQGNHARTKEYYLAHALEAYFRTDQSDIYFDRDMSTTKHAILGNTFVGYHHGNCKLDDLPLIFATSPSSSVDFGNCEYREVHTGDKHHYMAKEIKGVRVQQLPSLAGVDRWHVDKNFVNSIRAGLAMVYHPTKGKICEFEERIRIND